MFVRKDGMVTGSILVRDLPVASPKKTRKPQPQPSAPESSPPQPQPETPPADSKPADYAPKSEWVDYAVHQGADHSEAEALTKADLIELYGGQQ